MQKNSKMIIRLLFFTFVAIFLTGVNSVQAVQDFAEIQYERNFENSEVISCNCIAFRLDDIQDYWLHDTHIELIKIFYEGKFL